MCDGDDDGDETREPDVRAGVFCSVPIGVLLTRVDDRYGMVGMMMCTIRCKHACAECVKSVCLGVFGCDELAEHSSDMCRTICCAPGCTGTPIVRT